VHFRGLGVVKHFAVRLGIEHFTITVEMGTFRGEVARLFKTPQLTQ
jgi:hypothetical protein